MSNSKMPKPFTKHGRNIYQTKAMEKWATTELSLCHSCQIRFACLESTVLRAEEHPGKIMAVIQCDEFVENQG